MQPAGQDGTAPEVAAAATAEEEALKRNTDCVYFLASPLTCKKGVECEYRHSEGARVNPRDCRFWLNGNCLNPKCLFRHPPLDGLMKTSTTPGMHSGATSTRLPVSYSYLPAAHYPNKQSTPCYYFQKGACLKGDQCSFMHGPESKKAPSVKQQVPKVSTHESTPPPPMTKASPSHDKFAKQKFPAAKYDSSGDVAHFLGEPAIKAQTAPAYVLLQKDNIQSDIEWSKSQTNNVPVSSGSEPNRHLSHHSEVLNDDLQDNGEGDEFLHESSPGFDVLVDGHTENPMYFHNEEGFPETSVHDMGLNTASDFVNRYASDDDTMARHESWQFSEMDEYGQFMGVHDRYGRRHHDFSPERRGRISMSNRRRSHVEETSTEFDASDLRHRLQKRRMLNGSRSSVSPDRRELYGNDGRYVEKCRNEDYNSCGEQRVPREVPISKRLQGRITLPKRSTTENRGDFHFRQDIGGGRSKGRISPGRLTEYHGRLHNRINLRRHNEDFSSEERKPSLRSIQRDEVILDFAGPKSLSELKVQKSSMNTGQRSVDNGSSILSREEKYMKLGRPLGHEEAETFSFEGPKPLSIILKRKRQLLNCAEPSNGDDRDNHEVGQASTVGAVTATSAMHVHVGQSLNSERVDEDNYKSTKGSENRVVEMQENVHILADPGTQHHVQSSSQEEACEMEDDEIQHMENPEFEKYDQGDGEFDYEIDEGEEFKAEEDYDNACPDDEEFLEEEGNEEGSNFDEKFGVLFS